MRSFTPSIQLALLFSTLGSAHPSDLSPFILAVEGQETIYLNNDTSPHPAAERGSLELFKRQNCEANYNYCSTVVTTAVCCSIDAVCSQDDGGNAACCPLGTFCTGKIPLASAAIPATTTSSSSGSSSSNSGGAITIPSTSSIQPTTVASTVFPTGLTPSYVTNAYNYPFPYISTTFANSAACASAYSTCAAQSALCASSLQGVAPYGVSISAPGGGTTVTGASLGAAAAASVCASLSSLACPGVAGGCQVFGTASAATAAAAGSRAHGRLLPGSDWSLWAAAVVAVITGVVGWLL